MTYLAGNYRKSQDFAKAQGWITGYEILTNLGDRYHRVYSGASA